MKKERQKQAKLMGSLTERWHASGLSKSAFCRQVGIRQGTFYY